MKFLHIADVHLDTPFGGVNPEKAAQLRANLRETLFRSFAYAKSNNIPLVLIAGDLFDDKFTSKETVSELVRHFDEYSTLTFVISPGNHDPYNNISLYKRLNFPQNVHIFTKSILEKFSFDFDGEAVDVYGYAFTESQLDGCPFSGRACSDKNVINLLCAHCDLVSPLAKKAFTTSAEIGRFGCDYAALGHIHNRFNDGFLQKSYETFFAYSGCIEGRGFDECDEMGGIVVNINKSEGVITNFKADFISFSSHLYRSIKVDVSGASRFDDVIEFAKRETASFCAKAASTSLRIVLEGSVSPDLSIDNKALAEIFSNFYSFEIYDETLPVYSDDALKSDPTIRGAFYNELLPMLKSDSPQQRKAAAEALRMGLAVLSGSDIF